VEVLAGGASGRPGCRVLIGARRRRYAILRQFLESESNPVGKLKITVVAVLCAMTIGTAGLWHGLSQQPGIDFLEF
jgi:hypothetical protein